MKNIVIATAALSGLGLAFGVIIAWASKKFHVAVDPRLAKVTALLPGINCGACGRAGCANLAEALLEGTAEVSACVACHGEAKQSITELLGNGAAQTQKVSLVAAVACGGGTRARDKFTYSGFKDCRAAVLIQGGHKECRYACVGLGTCAAVCPFAAITMGDDGLPHVDAARCVGCKKCVAVCPRAIISMVERAKKVYIKCKSREKGPQVMKQCSAGCIACGKCVKECPSKAITIVDNLATIDYAKCIGCTACVAVCPTKAIAVL